MSDKTDYKRLKASIEKKNVALSNENRTLRNLVRMAQRLMTEDQKKEYLENIKKESFV